MDTFDVRSNIDQLSKILTVRVADDDPVVSVEV